ncbi:MAG: transcriptional regulator [Rariglobus sp.]|jgi:predicted NBD/HSP70 family sugar kinase|nr:transcriptional regulator [Rariglobus sp.]
MKIVPPLDPGFVSAALWTREYRRLVDRDASSRPCKLVLMQADGSVFHHEERLLGASHPEAARTLRHVERLLKFLLWQKGGSRVRVAGAPEVAAFLKKEYSPSGARAFDHAFMGDKVYEEPFTVEAAGFDELPAGQSQSLAIGRNLEGCRIGFDLGGSDRKAAALIDGKVVYSEEIAWDPYFQKDPAYHIEGVHDSLKRAAAHLPRVDAIGGSAAGVYVNNEVRVASLFRGVSADDFDAHIRRMFFSLRERWGGVPFEVVNDGEVTALAASMSLGLNSVLGISMGTSQAGGYVTPAGTITPWLNELAFAPIDYRVDAPRDEWSGDAGCGVQYFSQQGVGRLAVLAGFEFPAEMGLPERLVEVQKAMAAGDHRARAVYETIGVCFGHALAHYADFYELSHVLILGRVTSGPGGEIILERARAVLRAEFPELAGRLSLHTPDENNKRHGQAVAAASLPATAPVVC